MPTSGSRTEFLAVDALGSASDIQYGRKGGWFISTKKAAFIGILFVVAVILVGVLVHYFAYKEPQKAASSQGTGTESSVVPGSTNGVTTEAPISAAQLRLPGDVTPSLYRLSLDPYLDKPDSDGKSFMYEGKVSIVIHCINSTKKLSLHSKNLVIGDTVSIAIHNETEVQEVVSEPSPAAPTIPPSIETVTPEGKDNSTKDNSTSTDAPNVPPASENSTQVAAEVVTTLPPPPAPVATQSSANATNATENVSQNSTLNATLTDTQTAPQNTSNTSQNDTQSATSSTAAPLRRRKRSHRRHQQRRESHPTTTKSPPVTTYAPGTPPRITDRHIDEKTEMITFTVEPPLQAGQVYKLDIPFSGLLRNDTLYGFYASKYKDANNKIKWMATTQFEAPHAREAFPCFDEPAMKAKFEISIARGTDMITISNMPLKTTEKMKDKPERVWDHYQVSPTMSTYLVAFIVAPADFMPTNDTMAAYLKGKGGNQTGPEFKVYARGELIDTASYAASIGPKVLDYYGEYFGIPYPLPKMHMAAIPDFAAGAMENWGLITYRETVLLFDEKSSATFYKEAVAITVAHEIAHQWFGNLVTMKWWNDLWLNEGFATYMQYVGSDHVEPTWAMMDKFVVGEQQRVMLMDSLNSTHPVSSPVNNPAQIAEVFDSICYKKGASLIRMLNNSISQEVLRKGLSRYLNSLKYKNAEEADLWEALTEETKQAPESLLPEKTSVKEIMDTWTLQDGYPVVTVTRDYEKGSAELTQERFTLDNKTYETLWYIPVSYATQEEMSDATNASRRTFPRTWLKKEKSTSIPNLTKPKSESWVLFNIHSTGFYRVNYDEKNWELLAAHLLNSGQNDTLAPVIRAQLIDDAMSLARAGHVGYNVALNLTKYLATKEKDYIPWRAALANLGFLNKMLRDTTDYGLFKDYILKTFTPMKSVVGYEAVRDESQLQSLLRPLILQGLLIGPDQEVEKWAAQLFSKWMNSSNPDNENPIPVDMRSAVYCAAIKAGDRVEWNFVLERFKSASDKPSEESVLLESLGCSREDWLITTLLDKSLGKDNDIRRQSAFKVWRMMPSSSISSRVTFNYVRRNWDSIYNEFGKDEYLMRDIIVGSISGLTTDLDLQDVKEFRDKNEGKFTFVERTLKQQIETLESRVDWHKRYYADIVTWLQQNK